MWNKQTQEKDMLQRKARTQTNDKKDNPVRAAKTVAGGLLEELRIQLLN